MKILIADDEDGIRLILRKSLEKMGHEVVECRDGKDVMGLLFTGDLPQLLFLDWMMPNVDGLEVCRQIRQRQDLPFTHITLLTHRVDRNDIIEGFRAGADDYLTKPLHTEELQARLQAALGMVELSNMVQRQRLRMIATAKMATLGEMASGIAHSINNPLTIIISYMNQLQSALEGGKLDTNRCQASFEIVTRTAHRIAKIVQGLRTFATDGDVLPREKTSVRLVIDDTLALCAAKIKERKVTLKLVSVPEDLIFTVTGVQISQALLSLIENALLAAADSRDTWIEVDVSDDNDHVHIAVSDSGSGVPPDIRAKIFQPFFTTREVGKGAGLGLSIAKGIIDSHKGKIKLDEESLHTRFVISLPKSA